MGIKLFMRRLTVLLVGASVLLPLIPVSGEAKNDRNKDKIIIHIGTPSVWSMGQAHYLLAKMQKENRELKTNMPKADDLDANGIQATRIQMLRTLLDIETQLSEKMGVENRAAMNEFKEKLRRREDAKTELLERKVELETIDEDLARLNKDLAKLETEHKQIKTERERPKTDPEDPSKNLPTPPPGERENTLEQDIAILKQKIKSRGEERTRVNTEVTTLDTRANADVAAPTLTETQFLHTAPTLPTASKAVTDRIETILKGMKDPRFAASIVLDNYIGMQYEIISKQLTLLRDEIGPHERIVFLELPSSIYTVACKSDEHIAQVQWQVTGYYEDNDLKGNREDLEYVKTEDEQNYKGRTDYIKERDEAQKKLREKKLIDASKTKRDEAKTKKDDNQKIETADGEFNLGEPWKPADSTSIRAVDIIPRQSALNVNDVQSTISQKNFLGVFKFLVGLGIKVDYQRQRELYEQYLQQEVFAAGFGKGRNTFGWTFGPLPGTKRLAPGVRTTYAVLAIPRAASLLSLKAKGVAFHRKQAPALIDGLANLDYSDSDHLVFEDDFTIIIPNEETERFHVESIYYTPARVGEPVTAVVKGDYFSPQSGILVDGTPLVKSLSLGNTATSDAVKDPEGKGVRGQYEMVSSREIVMKFSMADGYIGTPNITLVSPEKSSALNFITVLINNHRPNTTLRNLVVSEPMFMPSFSLEKKLFDLKDESNTKDEPKFKTARLKGTGLRRRAEVWVNGEKLKLFRKQESQLNLVREELGLPYWASLNRKLLQPLRERFGVDEDQLYEAVKGERIRKSVEKRKAEKSNPTDKEVADWTKAEREEIEKAFEYPDPTKMDQYIIEQSTGEYFLRFNKSKDTPEEYHIRYRQNAIHGFDADEFTHKVTPDPPAKEAIVMNYAPNAKTGKALVDVRFKTDKPIVVARVSPTNQGALFGKIIEEGKDNKGKNQYRGTFLVDFDNLGGQKVEKKSVSITVFFKPDEVPSKKTKGTPKLTDFKTYDIDLPLRPKLTKATLNFAIAEGEQGQVITIEGVNLQRITKVAVGDKQAEIIGSTEHGILLIKLPKGMAINKDVTVQIPLILETADGTKVSVVATVGKTEPDKPARK